MAKLKVGGQKKVAHPHLHARLAFLQKAAQMLEAQQQASPENQLEGGQVAQNSDSGSSGVSHPKSNAVARELSSHTTAIIKKAKIRIPAEVKRTICKGCSSKLIDGCSSSSRTENKSRNAQKPWAEVHVVMCLSCGMEKRFPIGQRNEIKDDSPGALI